MPPCSPQFPCTVPLAYLGVGLRGDEKRNKKIVLMRRLRHSATFALAGYYLTISQSPANISEIDGTQLSARPVSSL